MADATIRAKMTMDNGQFLQAARESTAELKRVKAESSGLAVKMSGANNVANGLASVMKGQLSAGFASVGSGLSALCPKLMALLGPIGLVTAAFGAAYKAARALSESTGLDKWMQKQFSSPEDAEVLEKIKRLDQEAKQRREQRQAQKETAQIKDESGRMAEERLRGVAKIDAAFARESEETQKKIDAAKNDDVRNALMDRMEMLRAFHQQDVEAATKAEVEKLKAYTETEAKKLEAVKRAEDAKAAAVTRRTESIEDENDRMRVSAKEGTAKIQAEYAMRMKAVERQIAEPGTTTEQRGLLEEQLTLLSEEREREIQQSASKAIRQPMISRAADQMASVGGFLGGERVGLQIQNKAEQLQKQNNQILTSNTTAIQSLTEQVQALSGAMTGDVQ